MLVAQEPWIRWDYVARHLDTIAQATVEHIQLTAIAVVLGFMIAAPVGVLGARWPPAREAILSVMGIFYSIPALALFALLIPFTGLSIVTSEIGLVGYTLVILVRNIVVGLEGVPAEVVDAATGMGYRPLARLLRVELPLAVPTILAGVRIATVTTIGLVTITALIGAGGLGKFILEGLIRDFPTPLLVGSVLSIALALVADVSLAFFQRLITPWARQGT